MLSSSTKATSQMTCSPMNIGDGFTPPSPVPENACISLISMIHSFKEIEYCGEEGYRVVTQPPFPHKISQPALVRVEQLRTAVPLLDIREHLLPYR